MRVHITVRRGAGANPGDDIVDPLIANREVAIARGRNELDERASGFQPVTVELPHRPGIRPGQIIEVIDMLFGVTWYGKIVAVTHSFQLGTYITSLEVRRPTEFVV